MDYTLAELLTREQLLNILTERQLNIPNIEEIPHAELVRLYKSFALPLARRESHRSHKNQSRVNDSPKQPDKDPFDRTNHSISALPMDVDESEHIQLARNSSSISSSTLSERIMQCEKRSRNYKNLNPKTDEFLSIATKRIKISWT